MIDCFGKMEGDPNNEAAKMAFWNAAVCLAAMKADNPFRANQRYAMNAEKKPHKVPCVITAVLED